MLRFVQSALSFGMLLFALSACVPDAGILSGGSWQSAGLANQRIRAIAVDPNNPQTLYAGGTQGAIFVSIDAGQHWTKRSTISSSPTMLYALSLNSSGKKLYASTDAGLFVTTDAARQWNVISTSSSGLPSDGYTAVAFGSGGSAYIGTTHHGVFMSNNDGAIWKSASGNLPQNRVINGLAVDTAQNRLWVATSSGAYHSDDEGKSWSSSHNGLPTDGVVNTIQPAIAVDGSQGLVYAGTKHGFFRSLDSGAHWTLSSSALQGVSVYSILVDFRSANGSTVYVGTNAGAFRSDDGGQNWRGVASGFPRKTPVYVLVTGANNNSQLYAAANDVYLFPGSNTGISPSRIISLLLIVLFFFLLYVLIRRGARRQRSMFKSDSI